MDSILCLSFGDFSSSSEPRSATWRSARASRSARATSDTGTSCVYGSPSCASPRRRGGDELHRVCAARLVRAVGRRCLVTRSSSRAGDAPEGRSRRPSSWLGRGTASCTRFSWTTSRARRTGRARGRRSRTEARSLRGRPRHVRLAQPTRFGSARGRIRRPGFSRGNGRAWDAVCARTRARLLAGRAGAGRSRAPFALA